MRYSDGAAFLLLALLLLAQPSALGQAAELAAELARRAALPRAPLLPPEAFAGASAPRELELAPDGAHLAYVAGERGKALVYVQPLDGGPVRRLMRLEAEARLYWSTDGTLLFVEQQDGLAAVAVRDGANARLAVFDKENGNAVTRFAGVDPGRPRHAVVHEYDRVRRSSRLLRIGADGVRQLLYQGPGPVSGHLFGSDGRLAVIRREDERFRRVLLRRMGARWIEFSHCAPFRPCGLAALSADGRRLLLRTQHDGDREALVEVALADGARRTVHADPLGLADLAGLTPSAAGGQPILAAYVLPQPRMAGIGAAGKRIAADIARRFPGGGVTARSCTPAHCLLAERGSRLSEARYWLYGLRMRRFVPVLEHLRSAMPERHLAATIALRYPASDGAMVHGYLTLPPGLPAHALPMVTLVHGGPWNHVDGGYSGLVQLLANRGVAVFQPNFRGSTGYGSRYMLAAGADYGNGRVQADIVDGVRWLLAQGVGDPRRLGIVGASFGGYATLLALTHTPGLFRFGMATQPSPDFSRTLRLAVGKAPAAGEAPFGQVLRELGIDAADPAVLAALGRDAPARHAARVSAPLLLVAGGRDDKVEVEAVVDYVARLQGLGKPVGLLLDPDLGHNTDDPVVKRAQVHLLLRMLHLHLDGPPPPPPDAGVARYLARTLRADAALVP